MTLSCASERETLARGSWEIEIPAADTTGATMYQLDFGVPSVEPYAKRAMADVDPAYWVWFIPVASPR